MNQDQTTNKTMRCPMCGHFIAITQRVDLLKVDVEDHWCNGRKQGA